MDFRLEVKLGTTALNDHLPFAFLLLVALAFLMRSSHAEQNEQPIQIRQASATASTGVEAFSGYHLPRSNGHSIYFLPGSVDFDESARLAIIETASRLEADPALQVMLKAYADTSSDGENVDELRKNRAAAVADALFSRGITQRQVSISVSHDDEKNIASCSSEYCRQSYRRVGLMFSRTSSK